MMRSRAPIRCPPPGSIVAGKYRVERELGEGGMGLVLEATHLTLDQRVALKRLKLEPAGYEESLRRFLREARVAAKLPAEHVARAIDAGATETGIPYLAMELLEGHDLAAEIARRGPLGVEESVDVVLEASAGATQATSTGSTTPKRCSARGPSKDGEPNGTPIATLETTPGRLARSEDVLYFSGIVGDTKIKFTDVHGGVVSTFHTAPDGVSSLAADESHVDWVTNLAMKNEVHRKPRGADELAPSERIAELGDGSPENKPVVTVGPGGPYWCAFDGEFEDAKVSVYKRAE